MQTNRITAQEFRDGFDDWRRVHPLAVMGGKWTRNFMHFDPISPGYKLCVAYRSTRPYMIKVELLADKGVQLAHIDALVAQRQDIEREIGAKLCFNLDVGTEKKLQLFNHIDPLDGDPTEHYAWYAEKLELLLRVFEPRIRQLTGS